MRAGKGSVGGSFFVFLFAGIGGSVCFFWSREREVPSEHSKAEDIA